MVPRSRVELDHERLGTFPPVPPVGAMASGGRVELPQARFVASPPVPLARRLAHPLGFEPRTPRIEASCSSAELRMVLARAVRIELTSSGLEADILPLNYAHTEGAMRRPAKRYVATVV